MNYKFYKKILSKKETVLTDSIISKPGFKKISDRTLSYTERHRGIWFKPEYNLAEIQIAQDTDSFLYRALKRKTNRLIVSGWEITGENPDVVKYIKRRIKEIEYVSQKPWDILIAETAHDLFRFSNCMWVKSRNNFASSGKVRKVPGLEVEVEPVAGYFILPFETLAFKTKRNGEIKKVRQETPSGEWKEFFPRDIIHFYDNKKPGFAMGTPDTLTVLDDITLLRRLEENVESLIESNLYPLFHYQVGSDVYPERYSPDGLKETDIVKQTVEYMPAGGVYVSDHRHKITAIGSQGKALAIQDYLEYFKKRIFTGLGVSGVDMGEGDTANRSTANALSKSAIQDVEAMQKLLKTFLEFNVFSELLLEGGYDPLEDENKVEIRFGVVDVEIKSKEENQSVQLYTNNLISLNEARVRLGLRPEINEEQTFYERHTYPLAELKAPAPQGPPPGSTGPEKLSESIARPENQHGKLTGPKMGSDYLGILLKKLEDKTIMYYSEKSEDEKCHNIDAIIRKKKILFLGKLELLNKDEYNCIINNGIRSIVANNIIDEVIKNN